MNMSNAIRNFIERVDLKGKVHAARRSELVDQDLGAGMAFNVLKQKRRSAGCSLGTAAILLTRSVISAISRIGSTSPEIFFSSPARSRAEIQERKSS